jgi:dihydroorotase-like cyclic amidohydrolase
MAERFDLIIRGGTCLTPAGRLDTDIGVSDGRIVAVGDLAQASGETVFEAKGLHVLPGVIDSQVHFREPGNEYKEDLESGTRAAILGGVTAIFEMPNTNPPTVSAADLTDKIGRAERTGAPGAISPSSSVPRRKTSAASPGWSNWPAAAASRCSWDRRPARCWSPARGCCAML